MPKHPRRDFLKHGLAAGVGVWASGSAMHGFAQDSTGVVASSSPMQQINFACIGVGGKGAEDSAEVSKLGRIVALCDVDDRAVEKARLRTPDAKGYYDFREMLHDLGDKIDAVTISVPDHNHAVAAVMAMRMKKHCYCQKPLTQTVGEARMMGQVACENNVRTQMGNQGTARDALRRSAAILKSGKLGHIREVHVWTNRPIWPQDTKPLEGTPPIPSHLHWDQWLGRAAYQVYHTEYHPFNWRGFWNYGTGALGDMACHTFNMPYMGLDLRDPTIIEAECTGHNREKFPAKSKIKFHFPARGSRGPLTMTWYDGGNMPDSTLMKPEYVDWVKSQHPDVPDISSYLTSGSLIVADNAVVYAQGDYADEIKVFGMDEPTVEFTPSIGHYAEWAKSIESGIDPVSNFPNYAGPMTETILLGNLALWGGKQNEEGHWLGDKIEWDAANLRAKNRPDLDTLIHPSCRYGYTFDLVPKC